MGAKFLLRFPSGKAFKKPEKERLNQEIISAFEAVGDSSVRIEETYYESKHAAAEVVTYVVVILTALANISTIALAIREFLRKEKKVKDITIKTDSVEVRIKGTTSEDEIRTIISGARKLAKEQSK